MPKVRKKGLGLGQGAGAQDDGAVEDAAGRADREPREEGGELAHRLDERDGHHRHEVDDAGHGEVDETADDHEGHAERHHHQGAELAHDVDQVQGRT
jgi:hypothetical protein